MLLEIDNMPKISSIAVDPDDLPKLKALIMLEAKSKTVIGKETIAETLAMLILQQKVLFIRIMAGEIGVDIQKTFPAYSVRIRQCLLNLGLIDVPREENAEDIQPL